MRKFNAILTVLIVILFLAHAVFGSMQMAGVGTTALKRLTRGCFALIVVHIGIGIVLTAQTLRACRKTRAPYFRQNLLFWARRISGLAVMALMVIHMFSFVDRAESVYRLKEFNSYRLWMQILLVLSIALHVLTNVKPVLIAFGVRSLKPYSGDILLVISILLLVFALAFIYYFIRWQAV